MRGLENNCRVEVEGGDVFVRGRGWLVLNVRVTVVLQLSTVLFLVRLLLHPIVWRAAGKNRAFTCERQGDRAFQRAAGSADVIFARERRNGGGAGLENIGEEQPALANGIRGGSFKPKMYLSLSTAVPL